MLYGKYVIQKEIRDMLADPRNTQNKMVHHRSVQSGPDPKGSVIASSRILIIMD